MKKPMKKESRTAIQNSNSNHDRIVSPISKKVNLPDFINRQTVELPSFLSPGRTNDPAADVLAPKPLDSFSCPAFLFERAFVWAGIIGLSAWIWSMGIEAFLRLAGGAL